MRMDAYIIIVTPDGVKGLLHCFPGETLELEELQGLVGGCIEVVSSMIEPPEGYDRVVLIVNEEGKLKGLPANWPATDVADIGADVIVGNALIMAARGEELVGLPREVCRKVIDDWGLELC